MEAIEPRLLYAAVAPPAVTAPPIPGNWSLSFADEFDGASLGTIWTPHQYWSNGPTKGQGLEESDPANVAVNNGALQLTARIDNSLGTQYTGALVQAGGITGNPGVPTFSFLYGYAEARIQIPAGAGFWPAFWMLPASHHDENGEIDIMEVYDQNTTIVHGVLHRFGSQEQYSYHTGVDLSAGWHTFAVDWEPDHITWFIDGTSYATSTTQGLIPNEPMFPILDLAVGGDENNPTADTPFPGVMSVDYVHVWQQPAAPAVTINPASLSVPAGQTAAFTAVSSGYPVPTVQWQVSTDGGKTFSDMSGATSTTLSFAVAEAQNGYEYRAVFTNSLGAATTIPATLTVTTPVTLSAGGPNPSSAMQELSFTASVASGVPNGEQVLLEDASNANQLIATRTLAGGLATFVLPAGSLLAGTHNLIAVYAGDASFLPGQSPPYAQVVQVTVTSAVINGNSSALAGAQRSMVDSIVYGFSEAVNIGANAFSIAVASGQAGTAPALNWSALNPNADGSSTQWVVTFTGAGTVGGSIADGVYWITLNAGAVSAEANPSAPVASRAADTFYRMYGDVTGTGRVGNAASNLFLNAFNTRPGQLGYLAALDASGTGSRINNLDYNLFINNFNKRFAGFTATI